MVLHHVGYNLPLRLRRAPGWEQVYDDGLATILVRHTPQTEAWLERFQRGELVYPDSPGAQLFLAELDMQRGDRGAAIRRAVEVIQRFGAAGLEAAQRRQQVELQAALANDPQARRSVDLYAAIFAQRQR